MKRAEVLRKRKAMRSRIPKFRKSKGKLQKLVKGKWLRFSYSSKKKNGSLRYFKWRKKFVLQKMTRGHWMRAKNH